jgi:hypothetical protein
MILLLIRLTELRAGDVFLRNAVCSAMALVWRPLA